MRLLPTPPLLRIPLLLPLNRLAMPLLLPPTRRLTPPLTRAPPLPTRALLLLTRTLLPPMPKPRRKPLRRRSKRLLYGLNGRADGAETPRLPPAVLFPGS